MDTQTKSEIDRIAYNILREAKLQEPPIQIEELLDFLKLHRKFYDLEDPSLLKRFAHKLRIGGQRIIQIVRKIKLVAIWAPDEEQILIDRSQPPLKQLWASFHDATHTVLPWHRDFFLGDTAQTLEPYYQDLLEEDANYGASTLMFGPRFTEQALDLPIGWATIDKLQKLHKKSYVAVLRRYVEHGPDECLAGVVSTAFWQSKPDDQITRCRYFVRSKRFEVLFPAVSGEELRQFIDKSTRMRRGGPVGAFNVLLSDLSRKHHLFVGESFYNGHYVLTLFSPAE